MPDDGQLSKAQIQALEGDDTDPIEMYFNPKELSIGKTVPWTPHKVVEGDNPVMEFTSSTPKDLTLSGLLFDGFEDNTDVYTTYIARLEKLTLVMPDMHRPPLSLFVWGASEGLRFQGVVKSLKVKYTMFAKNGTPLRAQVDITMAQAVAAALSKEGGKNVAAAQKAKRQNGVITDGSNVSRSDTVGGRDTMAKNNIDDPNNIPPGTNIVT
jgi:hypothetical protein